LVDKLPLTDSYDYQFPFGWEDSNSYEMLAELKPNHYVTVIPIKRNRYEYTERLTGSEFPKLLLKFAKIDEE
jgi:hypothetical protein